MEGRVRAHIAGGVGGRSGRSCGNADGNPDVGFSRRAAVALGHEMKVG